MAVAPIAVLVVALLIAGSFVGQQVGRVPTLSSGASAPLPSLRATTEVGRPSPTDAPNQVFGLDILSVNEAIAIRDAGVDDQEIAVRGRYLPLPLDSFCPIILDRIAPVQSRCGFAVAITQDPEQRVRDDGSSRVTPIGPAISPSFEQIDAGSLDAINSRGCGKRIDCPRSADKSVVVIGHFDDRRAELCDATRRAQCRDSFVVDRLDSVDGQPVPTSVLDNVNGNHVWRFDDVEKFDAGDPAERILSVSVVSGSQNESLSIEPSLVTRSSWSGAGAVWLVRRLVGGALSTHAIVDGTDRVFAIQDDGSLRFVAGSLPTSDDATWPPKDAIVVQHRGSGADRQLVVAVVDLSGHLVAAGLAEPVSGPQGRPTVERLVRVERLNDTSISASWTGGLCDEHLTLRVRGDQAGVPDGLFLDGQRGGVCRMELVQWRIVLDFDHAVEPSQFATQYGIGPLVP
jgi:hypothetical protein